MKVSLKVYAMLARKISSALGHRVPGGVKPGAAVELELPDGSTLSRLLDMLNLDGGNGYIYLVGGKARKPDHPLSDGDEIRIFPPVGGG